MAKGILEEVESLMHFYTLCTVPWIEYCKIW